MEFIKFSLETNKFSSRNGASAWSEAPHWALVTSSHPGQIIFIHPSLGHGMPTRFVGSWLLLD
jgi:hypothetical protein